MTTETKRKAKRKLSNIDFSSEGAHLALVGDAIGGPANGADYALVMKSTNQFSEKFIEKMQKVRVTLELPEFLRMFFDMYYEDSEILARMMGYIPDDSFETGLETYEDYITSKLESFEIMKSLNEATDITSVISRLNEDQYFSLIKDQEKLEKVFKKIEKNTNDTKSDSVDDSADQESSTDVNTEVGANVEAEEIVSKAEKPVTKVIKYNKDSNGGWKLTSKTDINTQVEEESMSKTKVEKSEEVSTAEVEVVEKSLVDQMQSDMEAAKVELQKALDAQKEELQKAKEMIAKFEEEKKEVIRKSRLEQVKAAVKDIEKAEVLFKAVGLVESEKEFQEVVKALHELTSLVEQSELFVEKGVTVEGEGVELKEENAVAKIVKAKYSKK